MLTFDRLCNALFKPWVFILYLVLILASFFYFDQPVAHFFYGASIATHWSWVVWVTRCGSSFLYILIFFLLALFFRYIYRNNLWEKRFWFLELCVLIPNVITGILKILLGRARPLMWLEHQQFGFYGFKSVQSFWSFPSGHTTTVTAVVMGLIILFPRLAYGLLIIGVALIATRVILLDHYLSDVLATIYLVLIEIKVFHEQAKKYFSYC